MTKKFDWYFCVWILAFRQKVLALEGNHSFVTFLAPWPLFCKTFNWGWIFFCSFNIEKRKYDKYSSWSVPLNKKQRTREQPLLKMPSRQSHFKSSTKLKMIDEATVFDEATRHVSENTEWRKNPSFWRFCSNWCDWHFFYLGNLFSFILSSRKQQSFSSSRHRFKFSKQKLFRLCFVFGGKIKTNKLSWTVFFRFESGCIESFVSSETETDAGCFESGKNTRTGFYSNNKKVSLQRQQQLFNLKRWYRSKVFQ